MRISSQSLQYVGAEVVMRDSGLVVNLSTDTVTMAFPADSVAPVGGDFKAATWETDATASPTRYIARCLVGPTGTVTLGAGLYDVWIKVTHTPELWVGQALDPGTKRYLKLEVY